MRAVKAHEIQEMDRISIHEIGIPGTVLMENAARGASRIFLEHFRPSAGARVVILCGSGNNGGDGYVMARYLHQAGLKVRVLVLAKTDKIPGDALVNLEIIRRMDLDIREVTGPEGWTGAKDSLEGEFIIDGILGTGLNSPVRGLFGQVIEDVNRSGKPVMAIDIPSGLNADSGQIMGTAIRADITVTFGFPKLGQLIFPGAGLAGRLVRIDIGIPEKAASRSDPLYHIIGPDHFKDHLKDVSADAHKGNKGHLLILAGSTGKTGAAALTASGSLRAGAGLVTLGIPESLNPVLETKCTEAMTEPLPETEGGSLSLAAEKKIHRLMEGKTALAIGPGLTTHPETSALIRRLVRSCDLPAVIDADGLNALAGDADVLHNLHERIILTPHPGEMGRLTGLTGGDVQRDRAGIAEGFVKEYGCHLVLKGARTLISEPGGRTYINTTGNVALASGGSGDVLTGIIAGFLTRGWPPLKAAIAGVYVHGMAADLLAEDMGETGVLAGELPGVIPVLMDSIAMDRWPLKKPSFLTDLYQPL